MPPREMTLEPDDDTAESPSLPLEPLAALVATPASAPPEAPVVAMVPPARSAPRHTTHPVTVPAPPPTQAEAFQTLCRYLAQALDEDLPGSAHAEEIMGWYENGNITVSWAHAVQLLERVIGVPMGH